MGFFGPKMVAMVVVAWVAMMAAAARGQQTCVQQLIPCGPYVNNATTKPPESCCQPLRDAVKNDVQCLCAIYKTPDILKAFNISLDKALELARLCGATTNLSPCTALAPGSNPPPATPGGNGSGSTHRATWFGISGLMSFFFFWWSILA